MNTHVCENCGQEWPLDRYSFSTRGETCFRCHTQDVTTAYLACPGGRAEFHGPTIRERQERTVSEARKAGLDPRPVNRVYAGP